MAEEKVKKVKETDNRLDASKSGFDPKISKMYTFEVFEKYFEKHFKGDARKVYDKLVKDSK